MSRLERRNYGRGHGYKIDGAKVLGVTTISGTIPKPALTKWAAQCAADEAVNHWAELSELPPMERHDRILWAHRNTVRKAGIRGTEIHTLGEKLAHGEPVQVPDEHRGPVHAYARFLDRWDVEIIATETPVAHVTYRYAGTADAWATVGALGGMRVLLDLKTGKGVYSEAALQLAAYRYAELWQPNGPDSEEPLPPVDGVYVAHILSDDVRMIPVTADERVFKHFRYLQQTALLLEQIKDDPLVGEAITPVMAQEGAR